MKRFLSLLLVVLMLMPSIANIPFTAFAAGNPVNVSSGRYAYISGDLGNPTDKLTDGDTSDGGAYNFSNLHSDLQAAITDASDNYALIDLGAKYDISAVKVSNYPGKKTAAKVYVSNDANAPIADWTYYGERPKSTEPTVTVTGEAVTARYVRVYLTYYAYSDSNIGTNWGWLSEISVMGTLAEGEKEPDAQGKLLKLVPRFGKIENYAGRTSFIFETPTLMGGTDEENGAIADALKNNTMTAIYTVTDAESGESYSFRYVPGDVGYEHADWFCRLPVCSFGCTLQSGHKYTLALDMYDGETLKYSGCSAKGAFFAPEGSDFELNGPITPTVVIDSESPLLGKKIIFMGDSITEAICERYNSETVPTAGWPGRIGSKNGMMWKNAGVSGATMSASANSEGLLRSENTVYKQAYNNKDNTYDLIIMQGAVNDGWFSHPVGQVTPDDMRDVTRLDLSTLAGGIEYTFAFVKENYPTAKLGFILTFKMPSSPYGYTASMDAAYEEVIKACEKWGVPYLDLYHDEEVENRLQPTVNYYALGDYVHPNNRGYDILYPYIEGFTLAVNAEENLTGPVTVEVPDYTPVSNGAPILPTDMNVAVGKPATIGTATTTTGKLTDGNRGTKESLGNWSNNENCYATVDLGAVYDVDKVNVWSGGYNNLFRFEISVSLDGENYTVVGAKKDLNMVFPEGYTVGFEKTSARYVRVRGLYNSKDASYPISEISVYGTINEDLTFEGIDLSVANAASVTLPDKTKTDKLTDGNKTSDPMTIPVIEGRSIIIDMGKEVTLSRIDFVMAESDSAFSVFGSTDQKEWVKLTAKTLANATNKPSLEVSGTYRYLKLRYDRGRTSIADSLVVFYEVKPYDESGNLVTGMTAPGFGAAVDGNDGSYCYIGKPDGGIVVDLGDARSIYKVALYVTDKRMSYTIEASLDGSKYTAFCGVEEAYEYDPEVGYVSYGNAYARYLRIFPTTYIDEEFGAYEIEIYVDGHIHNFSEAWSSDESGHWKTCTVCDEKNDFAAHKYTGVVTVKPTVTDEGEKVYTCQTCGYSYTEILPPDPLAAMEDVSTGKSAWLYTKPNSAGTEYSLVQKNAITNGSITDNNWAYGTFGTIYAKIDLGDFYDIGAVTVVGYAPYNHGWSVYVSTDDVEYKKIATCATVAHPNEGVTVKCNGEVARYVKVVADYYVTANQFSFREVTVFGIKSEQLVHTYDGEWQTSVSEHWKLCTRHGEEGMRGAHEFGMGTVTVEPTSTTEGEIVYTCKVCGYEKTETVPSNPLAGTTNVAEGKEGSLYTKNAKTDADYITKPCAGLTDGKTTDNWAYGAFGEMYALIDLGADYTLVGAKVVAYSPYNHAWSVYVSADGAVFTEVAKVETIAHPAEGVTVDFLQVTARYVKIVADYYVTPQQFSFREIEVYGTEGSLDGHHFSEEWSYNETNHWKVCTDEDCDEVAGLGAHEFNAGIVTLEPTETEDGVKTYTCKVCGAAKTVVIPAIQEEPTNVALNKTAWLYAKKNVAAATEYEFRELAALTDGKISENWAYGDFGEMYVLVDLGALHDISSVTVKGYAPYNHAWSVYVSADGESYMLAGKQEITAHPAEGVNLQIDAVSARYVKIVADYYVTKQQFSFREVEVYGVLTKLPTINVAPTATVTLPDGSETTCLTDGLYDDLLTVGELVAGNVLFDLGSAKPMTSIYVKTAEKESSYRIFASADGESWVVLGEKEYGNKVSEMTFEVAGSYRYIKVQGYGERVNKDGYAVAISEIDIFNGEDEYTDFVATSTNVIYGGNVNDGKYDNYSFYRKVSKFITLDLGEVQDVRKVVVFVPEGFYSAMVEYSVDGVNYKTLDMADTLEGYDPAAGLVLVPKEGYCMARYLRVSSYGCQDNQLQVSEIQVYVPGEEKPAEPIPGDLNGDGVLNISDVTELLVKLAAEEALSAEELALVDLNGDGILSISDVTALLTALAK